jgi:hypothetical protein
MISASRMLKLMAVLCILGVLGSVLGPIHAAVARTGSTWQLGNIVSGSGLGGSGSLAVAAFFDSRSSIGDGAFSGTLQDSRGVTSAISGLFALTDSDLVAPSPDCVNGQVTAAGKITSGSFSGYQVLLSVCVQSTGQQVPGSMVISQPVGGEPVFVGQSLGAGVKLLSASILSATFEAGSTFGAGSAGQGTVHTAETDVLLIDRSVLVGGAFTADISGQIDKFHSTWSGVKASIQPSCTLDTSGVTPSFSPLPNQPVSSTYTLTTCPPTSTGPLTAKLVFQLGSSLNPIYQGTGPATLKIEHEGIE